MQRAGRQVEGTRVEQQEGAFAGGDGGHFREADVVADGEGEGAVGGDVDQGQFVAGREDVGFAEGDFAGDVDVEEVEFAVGGEQGALRGEEEGSVMVFLRGGDVFGDGAAEEVGFGFEGEGGEGVVGGGLGGGRG